MWEIFLLILLVIVVVTLLTQVIVRWASFQVARQVEDRMRAAEVIINHEQLPRAWVLPYVKDSSGLISSAPNLKQTDQLGAKAKRACIKKIDDLIRFFGQERYTDSPESRGILLNGLIKTRNYWETMDNTTFFRTYISMETQNG